MKLYNCLITGASSGIGKDIAIELSKVSKHIYIVSRNVEKLEHVNDIIVKNNCDCTIVPLDLCDDSGLEYLASQISNRNKLIDIIISSAGQIKPLSPITSMNIKDAIDIYKLNYLANLRLIKNFHPLLIKSKNPYFGVISSINDSKKEQYWGVYQPIMSALNELVMTYAAENKNTSIRANVFCPDAVDTSLREKIMPGEDKSNIKSASEVAKKIVKHIMKDNTGKIIKI